MFDVIKGLAVMVALFIVMPGLAGNIETHYNREGVVVEVNSDEVIIEDTTENLWSFIGEGYKVGDKVKMRMFTNCTDNTIYDDEIEKIKIIY